MSVFKYNNNLQYLSKKNTLKIKIKHINLYF